MTLTENFTIFPNSILEKLFSSELTKNEIKIILFVMRYTFGFHREETELSLSFISKGTKIGKRRVIEAVKSLLEKKIITETKTASYITPREIKLNMSFFGGDKTDTTPGDKTNTTPRGQNVTQENKTIKNKTINKRFHTSRSGIITDGFDVDEFLKAALERRGV